MAHWHPSLNCSCSSCIFKSPSVQNVAMNVVSTCEIVQNRINGVYKWGMVWFSVGLAWGWTVHPHDPIILRLARLRKAQRSTPRPFPQDSELSRAGMEKMDRICAFVVCILCVYIYIYIYTDYDYIYTYMMCMNISKHQKFYYWILWDQNMTLILDDSCRNLKLWNNDDPPRDLGSPIFRQIIVMISMKMCKLNMFTIPDLPDFDTQDTNNHANSLNLDWIL